MEEHTYERRGLFDGLRVPFDPNMLLLAIGFVAGTNLVTWLIPRLTGDRMGTGDGAPYRDVLGGLWKWLVSFGSVDPGFNYGTWILSAVALVALWAFFSAAINRIAAMTIARQESVPIKEACSFSARKFLPVTFTIGLVVLIFVVLYGIANPLYGLVSRIPVLDVILSVVAFPLVILSSFLVVFSVLLGVFGFNLASSAIATESSDAWDGVTRAWNYILERPWITILVFALTGAVLYIVLTFGGVWRAWTIDSLSIGAWGMGDASKIVEVRAKDLDDEALIEAALGRAYLKPEQRARLGEEQAKAFNSAMEKTYAFVIPGKAQYVKGYVLGAYAGGKVFYRPDREEREALKDQKNLVKRVVNVASLIPWYWKATAWCIWLWTCLIEYVVAGYAVQYVFGANTLLYFLLRKEVEGEDYSEIVLDEDEFDDEAAWEVDVPTPAADASAGEAAAVAGGEVKSGQGTSEGGEDAAAESRGEAASEGEGKPQEATASEASAEGSEAAETAQTTEAGATGEDDAQPKSS